MGNLLSLWTWGFGSLGGIVNGRDDDACLDRTPSGVRSAITQSSCDDLHLVRVDLSSLWKAGYVPLRRVFNGRDDDACLDRTPLGVRSAIARSPIDHFGLVRASLFLLWKLAYASLRQLVRGRDNDSCQERTALGVRSAIRLSQSDDLVLVGYPLSSVNTVNSAHDKSIDDTNRKTNLSLNSDMTSFGDNIINARTNVVLTTCINVVNDENDTIANGIDRNSKSVFTTNNGGIIAFETTRNKVIDTSNIDSMNIKTISSSNDLFIDKFCFGSVNNSNEIKNGAVVECTDYAVDAYNDGKDQLVCSSNHADFIVDSNTSVDDGDSFKKDNVKTTCIVSSMVDVSNGHATINNEIATNHVFMSGISPSDPPSKCEHENSLSIAACVTKKNDSIDISAKSDVKKNNVFPKSALLKNNVDEDPSKDGKYCHTFSSNAPCSQRTRAAAGAHLFKYNSTPISRITRRRNNKRRRLKEDKHAERLVTLQCTTETEKLGSRYSISFLKHNVMVFDGGTDHETAPTLNSNVQGWCCHKIKDGNLEVCSPPSGDIGLKYQNNFDKHPRFILLPRKEAIGINNNGVKLCKAMINVSKHHNNLVRGTSKAVFGKNKYCCVGSKPRRNAPGIEPCQHRLTGVSSEDWDCIVSAVRRSEHAFYSYADTDAIRHIIEAKKVVSWETMEYSYVKHREAPSIFNGIAFGVNVYLRAHIDNDFTYSVIQVHTDCAEYKIEDDVVCYFCFPRLGIAVALKPGDFLLVNALEYHCLSSRCRNDIDLFCVSSYLKTAVVGGNDNKRELSKEELVCLESFENKNRPMKRSRSNP